MRNILQKGNKMFYAYIRQQVSSRVEIPSILKNRNGEVIKTPKDIAELFATEFEEVYTIEPAFTSENRLESTATLNTVEFNVVEIGQTLSSLDANSATGPDGIPAILLINCAIRIAPLLKILFQQSIDMIKIPTAWKHAIVTPIFKKGSIDNPKNYRPISLTSIIGKVMERIIVRQLREFIERNKLIPQQQHGFVEGRSTTTNLLTSLNAWTEALDKNKPVDVLYLDYAKAFDKVPHGRLLWKLKRAGITGNLLGWIREYLTNRTFQVRVGNTLSTRRRVTSGVPQGSVLGPLLFIIYTADFGERLQSDWICYADDTKLYVNPLEQQQQLQEDIRQVQIWSETWLLPLNQNKCKVLHIGKNNPKLQYNMSNHIIQPTEAEVDLGVIITKDLKWER